ncbi:Asp_protease_2 domain-containing protein [Cephalotus follicularis]|uniref:Asp_protease_2 domain-containing protein n=1 Tax=Cephalotus follicularis TaxID=3775 RepID=A0A1Q3C6B8_CEPFO|nr:Asp_protease_2 domain-containing protein [Cephalotus follicularis]
MYMRLMIKGQQVAAMVDKSATHSFLIERIVHRLDLKVDMHTNRIKAVDSQPQAVIGMAHSVKISMGDWDGKINLMVVPLDDFDLILGNEFFISEKIFIMPHLCGLLITNEQNLTLWRDMMLQRVGWIRESKRHKCCLHACGI